VGSFFFPSPPLCSFFLPPPKGGSKPTRPPNRGLFRTQNYGSFCLLLLSAFIRMGQLWRLLSTHPSPRHRRLWLDYMLTDVIDLVARGTMQVLSLSLSRLFPLSVLSPNTAGLDYQLLLVHRKGCFFRLLRFIERESLLSRDSTRRNVFLSSFNFVIASTKNLDFGHLSSLTSL